MKQKFPIGTLVWVDVKSPYMEHFETKFFGIVAYSYAQKFSWGSESNKNTYSIIVLNNDLTKVRNEIAWYHDIDLTKSNKLSKKQIINLLTDLDWLDIDISRIGEK